MNILMRVLFVRAVTIQVQPERFLYYLKWERPDWTRRT